MRGQIIALCHRQHIMQERFAAVYASVCTVEAKISLLGRVVAGEVTCSPGDQSPSVRGVHMPIRGHAASGAGSSHDFDQAP